MRPCTARYSSYVSTVQAITFELINTVEGDISDCSLSLPSLGQVCRSRSGSRSREEIGSCWPKLKVGESGYCNAWWLTNVEAKSNGISYW